MPARSKRLDRIPPYLFAEISRVKAELIAKGEDIIDLGIGDPDQPTPAPIVEALKRAAEDPATHSYDESARGWPRFLSASARWYKREFGVELNHETEMMEVIGSKEALAHIVWAFADPGDVVIVPDPAYPVYKTHAAMCGAEVYTSPLLESNSYLPDLGAIPAGIAKRAKLFFVCYPHNPTGALATEEFYRDAIAFCRENDTLLIADMAYIRVTYDGYRSPTVLQQEGAKDVVVEFHSLSKTFNMTGWRIGFVAGNPDAVAALAKLKDNIDTKQFPAVAEAAAFALENVSNEETLALYQRRRDILVDGLNSLGWKVKRPKATFYVWAPVPSGCTSADFAKLILQKAGVLCTPGSGFGEAGEGYIRMSLTVRGDKDGERLAEAVRRIKECGIRFTC
ncbi:MAG: LL-diaminopimelate aminotransferase [Armatimonadetes bacterium]|nr:LL-diaminopimelate aminotransferase [Armatimonadota bacterium]